MHFAVGTACMWLHVHERAAVVLAGGESDFVYAELVSGHIYWANTSARTQSWRSKGLVDATWERNSFWTDETWSWPQPNPDRATLTYGGKIVDALISGHAGSCDQTKCGSPYFDPDPNKFHMSVSDWNMCTSCLTSSLRVPDVEQLRQLTGMGFDTLASVHLSSDNECDDDLIGYLEKVGIHRNTYYPLLAAALPNEKGCTGGCPDLARPLCKSGSCVPPTCADAKPFCNENSVEGQRIRLLCGFTCGCHNITSSNLIGAGGEGCAPTCRARHSVQLKNQPCKDTPPDPSGTMFSNAKHQNMNVVVKGSKVEINGILLNVTWLGSFTEGSKKIVSVEDEKKGRVVLTDGTSFQNPEVKAQGALKAYVEEMMKHLHEMSVFYSAADFTGLVDIAEVTLKEGCNAVYLSHFLSDLSLLCHSELVSFGSSLKSLKPFCPVHTLLWLRTP